MLDNNDMTDELAFIKVCSIGRMKDAWNRNYERKKFCVLVEDSVANEEWKGGDLGFIIADAREAWAIEELDKAVKAAREMGVLTFALVITVEPLAPMTSMLCFNPEKFADDEEIAGNMYHVIKSVRGVLAIPGLVNLDFADFHAIFDRAGQLSFGHGEGNGENASKVAAEQCLKMIDDLYGGIAAATGIILNVSGSEDNLSMDEILEVSEMVAEQAPTDCNIIWGAGLDNSLGACVTVDILVQN